MALFCENCGARLSSDALFCEACGVRVDNNEENREGVIESYASREYVFSVFKGRGWQEKWKRFCADRSVGHHGIILTNTSECPMDKKDGFYEVLERYITYRAEQGTLYCVLNVATQAVKSPILGGKNNSVEFLVKLLREIYEVSPIEYLLILGDRNAIASARWESAVHFSKRENGDSDEFVDSDLPYSTLNATSAFENYALQAKIYVGRVPGIAQNGFFEVCAYMENTMRLERRVAKPQIFSMTSHEWSESTHHQIDRLQPDWHEIPTQTFVSKEEFVDKNDGITEEDFGRYRMTVHPRPEGHELLCFHLHGGAHSNYWYSKLLLDGSKWGKAFSPRCLPVKEDKAYVICTQACYGAKPFFVEGESQSVLITALQNRCLGFVGSTQVAWGPKPSCYRNGIKLYLADAVYETFPMYVSEGSSLGYAFTSAINVILDALSANQAPDIAVSVKTVSEFALYGDPSIRIVEATQRDEAQRERSNAKPGSGLRIAMPDVRRAVRVRLARVSERLEKIMDDYMASTNKHFADVKPQYYEADGFDGYKAVYAKDNAYGCVDAMAVYFDKDGNVMAEIIAQ
ncbi:MAG: zinc ribbon domain-containing protein [Ruminococcaceae bacterium]|nr:zinc ribbon domain-containing protein [Oscillospiraceae bacterium]